MKLKRTFQSLISGSALLGLFFFTACHTQRQVASNAVSLEQLKANALANFSKNIDEFNAYSDRPASDGPYNATNNKAFLTENAPLFLSSNEEVNKVYNYRWWMISKHLKEYQDTLDGNRYWVITEFFGPRPWASLSGAITCPAGHQFYDVRWLRDPEYLRSYAEYYMKGSAATLNQRENDNFLTYMSRPESHHFSSWMIDGIEAFLKVHPDVNWAEEMLPYMEQHQAVWDSLFRVNDPHAETAGLYKILDLYDGMEFSLSAVLGLIASQDAYQIYTEETWRDLYLGWGTTDQAAMSEEAKKFPKAFRKGYPDFYLARPSVNSYAYGNLSSLANLYELVNQGRSLPQFDAKSKRYQQEARQLQTKVLHTLWNNDDQFFNTYSAGDNAYGIQDYEARVRESVGYTPWYFGMIPQEEYKTYAAAWDMFSSQEGFLNQMGMTTAERQHPYYNEQAYAWNGRGWPFQNSVVYKAYANYLRDYKKEATAEEMQLLYDYIEKLTLMHDIEAPNIGEWYIPSDGQNFGGEKDYFHSTYPDIIIEDLIGLETFHDDKLILHPLLPEDQWDHFYLGNINYHGRTVDIAWNNDGDTDQSGKQGKLRVWVDGKLVASADRLNERLEVQLQ